MLRITPLLVLLLAALLVLPAAAQPAAAPAEAAARIDADRLHAHVRVLAADSLEGRGAGTGGGARARAYLSGVLAETGLRPLGDGFEHVFSFEARGESVEGVNLVGYVPGTRFPDRYVVVTAHYDHLGIHDGEIFNGADDNASGTAALVELAAYVAQHPLAHSVIFAALDAEERGLQGARAFVEAPPVPREAIRLNVNLDMVGRNAAGELYAAGTHHYPSLRPPLEAVAGRSAIALRFGHDRPDLPPGDDWTSASDHGPFHRAGIPFVYFGVEDHPDYHRATDDVEGIDPVFHDAAAETVLDALMTLDAHLADAAE